VTAVALIVQFTKSLLKKKLDDVYVRVYALVISLLLTFIFAGTGYSIDGVVLTVINAIIVAVAAMGGYEIITDPKAEKNK
ncbi:MAG TPA: hypothetical protein VFC68_02240, partial [Treponemataceae bacterium]|nr:hypothetical protein [Treponemataceae bacterium]